MKVQLKWRKGINTMIDEKNYLAQNDISILNDMISYGFNKNEMIEALNDCVNQKEFSMFITRLANILKNMSDEKFSLLIENYPLNDNINFII